MTFGTPSELAPGSDNWPTTWADDGHQYTIWGDGGGFGGTNSLGRVSLGVGRLEGDFPLFTGVNVWGGLNPQNPWQFPGKSYGIISIGGVLYSWLGYGGDNSLGSVQNTVLMKSTDKSATWTKLPVDPWWQNTDDLYLPSFLNFGQDNAGNDGFVYSYMVRGSSFAFNTNGCDLARVPVASIEDKSAYEWWTATGWTSVLGNREPVFTDPAGTRTVSCTYNPGLNLYFLTNEHQTNRFGIYVSENPWGPWETVVYEPALTASLSMYFAPKWWSADGLSGVMIYTGSGLSTNDNFAAVAVTLEANVATYDELFTRFASSGTAETRTLLGRIEVAISIAADKVLAGNDNVAPFLQTAGFHDNRVVWAKGVLGNAKSSAPRFLERMLAKRNTDSLTTIDALTGNSLQSEVDTFVDAFAGNQV